MRRNLPLIPVAETAVPVELFSIFSRGANTTANPADVPLGFSPDLLNMEATEDGAVKTARGYTEVGTDSTTSPVIGQFEYRNGTTRHIIKQCGTSGNEIRKWDGSSWSSIKTHGAGSATSASAALAGGILYIVDGNHAAQKYTGGSSTSDVAAIPTTATFITYLPSVDRLVAIISGGSKIRFSDSGAYETWPAGNEINVAPDDSTPVTMLVPSFGPLLIGKGRGGRGKFVWDGLTFGTTGLQPRYGEYAENPKAVAVTPYGVAFWNRAGVWINSSGYQDQLISEAITSTLRLITAGQASKVRLWFQANENRLYLAIPYNGSTTNNRLWFYEFSRNDDGSARGWYQLDAPAAEICAFEDSTGDINLVFGSPTTSKTYRRYRMNESGNIYNAAGSSMTSYWTTPVLRGARKAKLKNYRRLVHSFLSSTELNVLIGYREDENNGWTELTTTIGRTVPTWPLPAWSSGWSWPSRSRQVQVIDNFYNTGHSIQLRVYKAGTNTPITFYGFAFEEEERESYT